MPFISFSHQIYLVFLFAIPVLIFFHFYGLKNLRGRSLKFANFEAIARVKGIDLYSRNVAVLLFNITFVVLIVFALSGFTLHKEVDASSFSYIIVLDSSYSMTAKDIKPDRFSAAKNTAIRFIDSLPYDSRVGVMSFSGDSYIEKGITNNKQELKNTIKSIEISLVGGTDVFEAVFNSGKLLKNEENKAIVLLSDGQMNVGKLGDVIDYAVENEIMIHTIGVGTLEGGEVIYGISKIDEDVLKGLAYNTEGRYFMAGSAEELESSFDEVIQVTRKMSSIDLSRYFIMAAIVLFVLKQFLISTNQIIW